MGRLFTLRVDRYAQVSVRTNRYSVPVRLIGRTVRVMLHASEIVFYDGRAEVARHERLIAKGQARLELDHYLEVLVRKPGAFPGATALEQARSAGKFTPVHDAWWAAACKAHGDRDGTRALIEALLLGRHLHHEHLVAGLAAALRAGALTSDAVALEARNAADADDTPAPAAAPEPGRAGPGRGDVPDRAPPGPPAAGHSATAVGRGLRPAAATQAAGRPFHCRGRVAVTVKRHPRADRTGRRCRGRPGMPDAPAAHHSGPVS